VAAAPVEPQRPGVAYPPVQGSSSPPASTPAATQRVPTPVQDFNARAPVGAIAVPATTRVDVNDARARDRHADRRNQPRLLALRSARAESAAARAGLRAAAPVHELSREIALERDLPSLLNKILITIFRFVRADRGVIFLTGSDGGLVPSSTLRRDGTDAPIPVSSTIMNHVIRERATVLTHDAAMDFAASKGKSMILNRISSAIVAPLLHNDEILGVLWLDSERSRSSSRRTWRSSRPVAAQGRDVHRDQHPR
jgi:adenylate cyclase